MQTWIVGSMRCCFPISCGFPLQSAKRAHCRSWKRKPTPAQHLSGQNYFNIRSVSVEQLELGNSTELLQFVSVGMTISGVFCSGVSTSCRRIYEFSAQGLSAIQFTGPFKLAFFCLKYSTKIVHFDSIWCFGLFYTKYTKLMPFYFTSIHHKGIRSEIFWHSWVIFFLISNNPYTTFRVYKKHSRWINCKKKHIFYISSLSIVLRGPR